MKKMVYFLSLGLFFSTMAHAESKCFLVKEQNQILKMEGECKSRYAPESTFKIPLSLIGYDHKILANENNPEWHPKEGYDLYLNLWKSPHNPRTWMRDSCVWYSQVLTQKLGMQNFKEYIQKFSYGNQDVSGDKGKNNGLTHSWLSSSLEISPEEQTIFLQKLVENKLPVSAKSHEMTKKILFMQELPGGWKLYGKTGNGRLLTQNRTQKSLLQHGWFVGWIERDGRIITFANHIVDDKKQETFASFRARNEVLIKLWYLIDEMEA